MRAQFPLIAIILFGFCCNYTDNRERSIPTEVDSAKSIAPIKPDSFEQHSYLIYGVGHQSDTPYFITATGMILVYKNKFYLATASHVFSNWGTVQYTFEYPPSSYPDTLYLRVYQKPDNRPKYIPIDIRDKKGKNKIHAYQTPDIDFQQIYPDTNWNLYSFSMPLQILTESREGVPSAALTYGYPISEPAGVNWTFEEGLDTVKRLPSTKALGTPYQKFYEKVPWGNVKVDPINCVILFSADQNIGNGFSGAPVFLKAKNLKPFVVMCIGGDTLMSQGHKVLAIRPEYINKAFFRKYGQ